MESFLVAVLAMTIFSLMGYCAVSGIRNQLKGKSNGKR